MGFKCMKFKASYITSGKLKKEKLPQVVCLKYIQNSEFDNLSYPPLPFNNSSSKPIKIKPTTPKPEVLSIFNAPPPPPNEIDPEPEEIQVTEPPKSILKVTNRYENSQVEAPNIITPPDDIKPSLTYSTENSVQNNENPEEVPPSLTTEQEEVLPSFTTEQEEVPSSYTTEQEVSSSHESKEVDILKKEEQEEIISSEDDTSQNSQYKVRFAKKPKPNYELKSNDDSEISDYESEDEDLDLTDSNNNRDEYSSQVENIFFAGIEAEVTPRIKKLPKDDDEV